MIHAERALDDVWVVGSTQAAPGHGVLPTNTFLLLGDRPVLVDTGLGADGEELLPRLWSLVAPEELATVFLSHEDADHAGNLSAVLTAAPRATLVSNYVTVSRLLEATPLPLDRVHVVNPGQEVPGSDGRLWAVRPPVYDAPGTLGVHDVATGVVLTADAFGTYLPRSPGTGEVSGEEVVAGFFDFNGVNHPWTSLVDRDRFAAVVDALAELGPRLLLSSHGVIAADLTETLLDALRRAPARAPAPAPDQERFQGLRRELG